MPANRCSPDDFEIANVAREQVEKIIEKFNRDSKPSTWQQLGFSHKSTKAKVMEVLQESTNGDLNDLRTLVDNLEIGWKETHGPVRLLMSPCRVFTNAP
jgi:hypothetical protein